jgi:hypothetical protein
MRRNKKPATYIGGRRQNTYDQLQIILLGVQIVSTL